MPFLPPAAAGHAPPPTLKIDPLFTDKVGYIATTWEMLSRGSWDPDAVQQLTAFVGQIAAELGTASFPEEHTDLRMQIDQLRAAANLLPPPSPAQVACITRSITAICGQTMPEAAAWFGADAMADRPCASCAYARLCRALRTLLMEKEWHS
jgi:hypothetical protein